MAACMEAAVADIVVDAAVASASKAVGHGEWVPITDWDDSVELPEGLGKR